MKKQRLQLDSMPEDILMTINYALIAARAYYRSNDCSNINELLEKTDAADMWLWNFASHRGNVVPQETPSVTEAEAESSEALDVQKRTCSNCKHWDSEDTDIGLKKNTGICFEATMQAEITKGHKAAVFCLNKYQMVWLITHKDFMCSSWKEKKQKP